jgi:hypothetical protein
MTRRLISIPIAVTIVLAPVMAAKTKRIELKPKDASGEIAIVSAGKARTYYPLSAQRSSIISVEGPGQVRILTRARFTPQSGDELEYSVRYRMDGGRENTFDVEGVTRSEAVVYKERTPGVPGDSRGITLKIGRGVHSIELALLDSLPQVSARYLFTHRKEKKAKWVALAPLAPLEPVDLFAGEGAVHCYRFSSEKPLKIEIIGPTDLRILTRVENSFNMKGVARYRLQIRQQGRVLQSFQLSSNRSETTTYRNNSKLVPGKAREIVFKVPKGKQQYEITTLDKGSLLGQIMFPQKDAKLGL